MPKSLSARALSPPPPRKTKYRASFDGFTLAETLITLAIIGVIAALTIPNLINRYQEQVTVNKVKKFYSTLTQALPQAIREYGTLDTWNINKTDNEAATKVYQQLINPYIKVAKDCGLDNKGNCIADVIYQNMDGSYKSAKYSTGTGQYGYYKFLLNDGSAGIIRGDNSKLNQENIYAILLYDVNGAKGPNRLGYDLFDFKILKDAVIPTGRRDYFMESFQWGSYMTAWLIYIGNMDYLRCPEKLSWDGKHSCK